MNYYNFKNNFWKIKYIFLLFLVVHDVNSDVDLLSDIDANIQLNETIDKKIYSNIPLHLKSFKDVINKKYLSDRFKDFNDNLNEVESEFKIIGRGDELLFGGVKNLDMSNDDNFDNGEFIPSNFLITGFYYDFDFRFFGDNDSEMKDIGYITLECAEPVELVLSASSRGVVSDTFKAVSEYGGQFQYLLFSLTMEDGAPFGNSPIFCDENVRTYNISAAIRSDSKSIVGNIKLIEPVDISLVKF